MAVYDTQGRPVHVDIQTAYTAGVQAVGVSTVGSTAGNTGTVTGTLVLAGSNNITLSQSTNASGATVFIQMTGAGAADGVNVISASGNTTGTLSTQSTGTVVLAGGANITLSQSSNTITIVGAAGGGGSVNFSAGTTSSSLTQVKFLDSNGVSFGLNTGSVITATVKTDYQSSNANYLTSQSNQAASGSNGSYTFQTLSFGALNGLTLYTSNSSVVGSYTVPTVPANSYNILSASGNTSGTLTTYSSGTLVLAGGNNITLSQSSNSITISGANVGGAQTGISGVGASNTTYTSGTVIWSGDNITVGSSVNGASQYVKLSGNAAQTVQPVAVSGSNGSFAFSTLTLGALNGLTFYTSNNSVVGSYTVPAAQTTQSAIKALGASNTGNTAGNTGVSTGIDWVFAGTNNVTVSQSTAGGGPNTLWISGPTVGGAQTGISGLGGSNTTFTSGTVILSDQANITIGSSLNGASQYLRFSVGNYITTARASNDAVGLNTAQTNVTWTVNSSGISLNAGGYAGSSSGTQSTVGSDIVMTHNTLGLNLGVPKYLTTAMASNAATISNVNLSAGTTSTNASAFTFVNSNGVSFGLGTGASAGQVTATVATNYLTTARASTDAIGLNTAQTNVTWTVNSSGLSLNAGGYAGTTSGSQSTAGSDLVMTHNTAGLNLGVPKWLTTAMLSNAATISNINLSAGTTSTNASAFSFVNSNGVSFGLGTGASAGQITATVATNYLTTARASNDAIGLNTAQTNVTWTVNSSGLSLNAAGYAGTGTSATNASITLNSAGLAISVAAPGAAAENNWVNLGGNTAGNTTASGSTIKWYGGANITLHGTNGSEVSIIGGGGGGGAAVGMSTDGHTSGNTGTFSSGTVVLAGSSSLTVHQSTGAGGVHTLWLKPAMSQLTAGNLISLSSAGSTVSVIGLGAGTATGFTGTNVSATMTLNTAGLSLQLSAGAGGGGGIAAGVSNTGNTAGNTGTYSTGTIVFAASNSMTLSQSSGGASVHTIWLQPLMWALSGGGGISLSTTGSTIVIYTV